MTDGAAPHDEWQARDVPEPLRLDDPVALKALAHPLRLRLLTTLGMNGPLNVKKVAELVGEPANSVSYHLSQLAAHGLVVPAEPPDGATRRERWWQTASPSGFRFNPDDVPDEASGAVVRTWLVQLATDNIDRMMASERLGRGRDLPHGNATVGAWLTHEEAVEADRLLDEALMFVARRFFAQREQGVLADGPGDDRLMYRLDAMFFADLTAAPGDHIMASTDAEFLADREAADTQGPPPADADRLDRAPDPTPDA